MTPHTELRRPALLATRSNGKIRELLPILRDAGFDGYTLTDAGLAMDPDEDRLEVYDAFADNAIAKARWFKQRTNAALVFADDSGLEVSALGGGPGVRSKRWSGRTDLEGAALDAANNAMLLSALAAVGAQHPTMRRARFVCAAAAVWSERELVVTGETAGVITTEPRGQNGFGYDPCFLSDELSATFGEASPSAKSSVSHRARAFRALVVALQRIHA